MSTEIFFDPEKQKQAPTNSWIFIDTNVLSFFLQDQDVLEKFLGIFLEDFFVVDPTVEFEFLRTAYLPAIEEEKRKFLQLPGFTVLPDNNHTHQEVRKNALLLGKILSFKGIKKTPLGDLFILGRFMMYQKALLLTNDWQDFSIPFLDRKNVYTFETPAGVRHLQLLEFNSKKYSSCLGEIDNLKKP